MASHSAQSLVASLSFVALGTRLQAEGAHVLLATNVDHLDFVRSFGLEVSATAGSCRADHESPEFLRGIATGDGPDLLYATPLTYQSACRISSALGVPMVLGSLFPAEAPLSNLGFRPWRAPEHPTFIHWSPELTKLQPWQAVSHRVTGFRVVGAQEDGRAQDHVFGGAEARRRLEAFLAAGEAPVYMGWGSMPVPRETASLAVRALKRAGLRGVVLGGWAKLDATMLAGQPDEEELLAYAAEHVIFVRNAPHEWLLPRCSVTVHHGGAGTVAAALRAGVPTVVTPCGLDQPENARVVEASGCGVALPQIASVTAEGLAAALERCAHDEEMRARSKAMAARLRSEDGLGCVVEEIAAYLEQKARESRGVAEARAQATALRLAARDFTRNIVARSPLAQHFAGVVAARRAARSVA